MVSLIKKIFSVNEVSK